MTDYRQITMDEILNPDSIVGRTYPEPCPRQAVRTSESSSRKWSSWQRRMPIYLSLQKDGGTPEWSILTEGSLLGESWMPNFSESPKEGEESFLSETLEGDVPDEYSLSETACLGILRRSRKRGKILPEVLMNALKMQSGLSEEEYGEMCLKWDAIPMEE